MKKLNREMLMKFNKLDFNRTDQVQLQTYWCRIADADCESWNPNEQEHSFWELHLTLSGESQITVNGKDHTLTKDTYIFLRPRSKHKINYETPDYSKLSWGFAIEKDDELCDILYEKFENTAVLPADKEMIDACSLIRENIEKEEFGYFSIIKNELNHIFSLVVRKSGVKNNGNFNKIKSEEFELIKKYISENLSDDISIDTVATQFSINQNAISRMCKKEYNMSFAQVKRELQAKAIINLLLETDYSLDKIAEITGFADRFSLGKFFKKYEGESPGSYRKTHKPTRWKKEQ